MQWFWLYVRARSTHPWLSVFYVLVQLLCPMPIFRFCAAIQSCNWVLDFSAFLDSCPVCINGLPHISVNLSSSLLLFPSSYPASLSAYWQHNFMRYSIYVQYVYLCLTFYYNKCMSVCLPVCCHWNIFSVTLEGGRGVGGRWTSEKVRGEVVDQRGLKYQHDWPYLQSINSILNTSKDDIKGLVSV